MSSLLPALVGVQSLTLAAILRLLALARRAQTEPAWDDLARIHSPSGRAFFPTTEARLELELAIYEVTRLERRGRRLR